MRRVFGGLALRVVKVSRHGDDSAVQVVVKGVFRAVAQRGQNLGADLDGRLGAAGGHYADHAIAIAITISAHQFIRQFFAVRNVCQATAHQAFHRGDGVVRVVLLLRGGGVANVTFAFGQIAHDGRKQHPPLVVRQAFADTVAHRGDEGMRGAKVNADGNAPLVGVRRLAGFGDLQQRHGFL